MNYGGIGLATCIERPIHLVTAAELVIRDQEMTRAETPIQDGEKVLLLPPVTGGEAPGG